MSRLSKIEAVTFDVGGTLIEPRPSVGHVYAEAAARHGVQGVSAELLSHRFAEAWSVLKDFNHTRPEWAELVDATFRGLADPLPSRTFFPELYSHFARPESWHVFEDTLPTLRTLASRGLKLGVISNWDERLRPLLRQLGLHNYFEAVVISCDVGFPKPSPIIFRHACEKLALPPAAILHVGDSAVMDAAGARAAGLRGLELRRGLARSSDEQINSLSELESLLQDSSTS